MIDEFSIQLADAWHSTGGIEILAAVLAVMYLLLAIKQRRVCWVVACISSCLYVWVLFGARLYMESALNGFYALMALYGYRQWTRRGADPPLGITRWPLARHAVGLAGVLGLSLVNWFFLRRFTSAAWPLVDSLVTWSSVFATLLVARKVYENWHWWLVIDAVSLCLCFTRHLYLTTLLFALYLAMILLGMREWSRDLLASDHVAQRA